MPATCAACAQPIHTGQAFVLDGMEVIHVRCARAGRTTALARAELEISKAQLEAARARRELELERAQRATTLENASDREEAMQGAIDILRATVESLSADLARARSELAALRSIPSGETDYPERDATEVRMSLLEL